MASMRRVVDLFIAGGVSGLPALGVTGEVARLTEVERQTVLDAVLDAAWMTAGVYDVRDDLYITG